jgi:beta-lactamase class D
MIRILPLLLFIISTFSFAQNVIERNNLKKFFDEYNHIGCFVLYDFKNDNYIKYNPARCDSEFIPASTFKIFNSLAALESGVIKDENEIIQWDSVKRFYDKWNQDLNLAQAYKYSAVWFYQELARRIGQERMQSYINLNEYGNQDISGGIDLFWLEGGLRISAVEQVELLKKIYLNEVTFSQRSIDILKKIMIYDQTDDYIIRAKTGWGMRSENQIGWFVGYVEKGDDVYFFATNVESKEPEEGFKSRIEITYDILRELKIIQ